MSERKRKVNTPSGITHRSIVPSSKNLESVHCESVLEKDFVFLVEMSKNVLSYFEQPLVTGYLNNRLIKRYPDFEITFTNGTKVYFEIKYAASIKNPDVKGRLAITKKLVNKSGYQYIVMTDTQIRENETLINNCKLMNFVKNRKMFKKNELENKTPSEETTLSSWINNVGSKEFAMSQIANQIIYTDLGSPLTPESRIRKTEVNDYEYI